MCGIPCSGKTTRATELARLLEAYITEHGAELAEKKIVVRPSIVVCNDESLKLDRRAAYAGKQAILTHYKQL